MKGMSETKMTRMKGNAAESKNGIFAMFLLLLLGCPFFFTVCV